MTQYTPPPRPDEDSNPEPPELPELPEVLWQRPTRLEVRITLLISLVAMGVILFAGTREDPLWHLVAIIAFFLVMGYNVFFSVRLSLSKGEPTR